MADATRNIIKLLPGMHAGTDDVIHRRSFLLTVYGPATVEHGFGVAQNWRDTPLGLRLVDLNARSAVYCDVGNTERPFPTLELTRVQIEEDGLDFQGAAVHVSACTLTVTDSTLRVTQPHLAALTASGVGGGHGQLATVERTLLEGSGTAGATISVADFASLRIVNSVIRNDDTDNGAIAFGSNVGPSSITFSTFYNARLVCPRSPAQPVVSRNNIFLNERANAPGDTVTGDRCVHSHVLAKPQATDIAGSGNMRDIDPRFVDAQRGDFRLLAGSPAIDKADPADAEPVDFAGAPRPQGVTSDIGAFEHKPM